MTESVEELKLQVVELKQQVKDLEAQIQNEPEKLKEKSFLTEGEWKLFCENSKFGISSEYVVKVQILVTLLRKYFHRSNETEIYLQSKETNIPDISEKVIEDMREIQIWCPRASLIGFYWLHHLLESDSEFVNFVEEMNERIAPKVIT